MRRSMTFPSRRGDAGPDPHRSGRRHRAVPAALARFVGANLTGANLTGAVLTEANFSGATGTPIGGGSASYSGTRCPDTVVVTSPVTCVGHGFAA